MLSNPLPSRYCAPAPQASATVGLTQEERSKLLASMYSLMPLLLLLLLLALLLLDACTIAALFAVAAVAVCMIAASEHGATVAVLLLLLSLRPQVSCAAAMSFVTAPRVASSTLMLKL
jgi:hypothetical protein